MDMTVQCSFIDHNQVGHTEGIGSWKGSVWQNGLDTNNSDIDRVEVDMVIQGRIIHQCKP